MLKTVFVVDDVEMLEDFQVEAISFEAYLGDYPKLNEPRIRIINLCDTSCYLSQGYYCSLLAEARRHHVLPSVKVINALRDVGSTLWLPCAVLGKVAVHTEIPITIVICMGEVADGRYRKIASKVFQEYAAPILSVTLAFESTGVRVQVRRISLAELSKEQRIFCLDTFMRYSQKVWRSRAEEKKYRWDMAILVNPEEDMPPSNKSALSRFIKAGEKLGIRTRTVTASEFNYLAQYDALFIRETTAIDHYTYRFAREAEHHGLVVIDDSNSILRCCNKVYLHDAFSYQKVPSLQSRILVNASDDSLDAVEEFLGYPMVLKMPESSFSKGVFKVESRSELKRVADKLLCESALVLAQKYMYTEFDWRIGVLNGRPLFACRYYMAKNHWQIYNHSSRRFSTGGFDALPTFEVPSPVLTAATKAASVIGNGLYGIDIKEDSGRAYVIEVNDNPNIDHGVEDSRLGDELYMQVMSEFLRRLEARGR